MITLQSSFEYVSDEVPPTDETYIQVIYPELSFITINDIESLNVTSTGTIDFKQNLLAKKYIKSVPINLIFGENYGDVITRHFKSLLQDHNTMKLDDISITFNIKYEDAKQSQLLQALYFIKQLKPDSESSTTPEVVRIKSVESVNTPLNQIIDNNLYILNRNRYQTFVERLFLRNNPTILLYVVNILLDLSGPSPSLSKTSPLILRQQVGQILRSFEIAESAIDEIYQFVTKNFDNLFDFPLQMPEIETLKLKGKITIEKTDQNDEITFDQYKFYQLSAEYHVFNPLFESKTLHISRYNWNENQFKDGIINFTFSDSQAINKINGPVTVQVTAYDDSVVYYQQFNVEDPKLKNLDIRVLSKFPSTLGNEINDEDPNKKIRGKIVSLSNDCALTGTIIIQTKTDNNDDWLTVSASKSDKAGNFTAPYPYGKFKSAQAVVSLDDKKKTPLNVNSDGSITTDFLYILINNNTKKNGTNDCKCDPTKTADRLPSQDELIQSDQFTQDIGGTCLNLTTPNRTLKEYNYQALVRHTDPGVANYMLLTGLDPDGNKIFQLKNNGKIKRNIIDIDNPVQWVDGSDTGGDNLSVYQAVTVATGHILHYKSELRSDGYSLGDLLYSVPLAPGQKKQIVVFDASHTLVGTENQNISEQDSLANNLLNERYIMDQIGGNIGESLQGQSDASTAGVSAGLGGSASSGFLGASLGVAGGYSNANSSASQNSSRNLSQSFNEVLKQNIMQNASSYRKLTASVVTTVTEGQKYNATTEVIANHNHCHSVTMMYFEVLRHMAVFQELVDVEECVFVPFLMTRFTMENVSKWADVLVTKLLTIHSNTYLKPFKFLTGQPGHPLLPAFDAIERIKTKYQWVDYPKDSFDNDLITSIDGELVIQTELPRPQTRYDFILSLPIVTKTVSHDETNVNDVVRAGLIRGLTGGLFGDASHTVDTEILVKSRVFDPFIKLDDNYESVPPADCVRIVSFNIIVVDGKTLDPVTYINGSNQDQVMWETYCNLIKASDSVADLREMLNKHFANKLISEWDTIFQSSIAPQVFKAIVETLSINAFSPDFTLLSKYNGGERYMRVFLHGSTNKTRKQIADDNGGKLMISSNSLEAKKLQDTPVTFNLITMSITYSTQHFHGVLFSGTVNGDILDGQEVSAPETFEETRDPRKEDLFLANKLIEHLNYNIEYYNKVLWYDLNPDRRWLLLDGFEIEIYDKYGVNEGSKSLSSVIKNNLITVAGNSLVFPVAPGYKVNRSLITRKGSEGSESLLDYYKPDTPPDPYRLSVPTKGVYMEAVMGSCDSCEKVKPNSSQDWNKFTTDQPTPIATVTPPVPTTTDWKPQYKDFAPPVISIQNAPNAPDPGTGLAAATDLLGQSGIFKDITGLDANQANAIKTYLSNNDNVKALAQMSSALAMQKQNIDSSSQIMDTMNTGKQDGALNNSDYNNLLKQHIQHQIDGGTSQNAQLEQQKDAQKPSLSGAAVDAVSQGKNVKAVTTDSDGNTQSIDIAGSVGESGQSSPPILAKIDGVIPILQQPKTDLCWATAATMMVNWKNKKQQSIQDVVKTAGDKFVDKLKLNDPNDHDGEGLYASEFPEFINALGMKAEARANYGPKYYIDLVNQYGPLWITIDANPVEGDKYVSPHIKVLIEVTGTYTDDGKNVFFTFLDPGYGARDSQKFPDFVKSFEQLVSDDPVPFLMVVHFSEKQQIRTNGNDGTAGATNGAGTVGEIISISDELYFDIKNGLSLIPPSHVNPSAAVGISPDPNKVFGFLNCVEIFAKNKYIKSSKNLKFNFKQVISSEKSFQRINNNWTQAYHSVGTQDDDPDPGLVKYDSELGIIYMYDSPGIPGLPTSQTFKLGGNSTSDVRATDIVVQMLFRTWVTGPKAVTWSGGSRPDTPVAKISEDLEWMSQVYIKRDNLTSNWHSTPKCKIISGSNATTEFSKSPDDNDF